MKCRIEKSDELVELFSLGNIFVSDFLQKDDNADENFKTPLTLCLSKKSGLVQLKDTADFDKMYKRYWYHSGTNKTMTDELHGIVNNIYGLMDISDDDVWVDIGCNDGTLLEKVTCDSVGFDPATNNCKKAHEKANTIVNDYFNSVSYFQQRNKKAKIITSIAMFYDLPDPVDFCNQIYQVLDDDGLWVIQMSYLPLMLNQLAFDNICHEHLEYYSLTALKHLLDKTNFKIIDCQLNDINGGSFRIYIQKNIAKANTFSTSPHRDVCSFRVNSLLSYEDELNLTSENTYIDWFNKILDLKHKTVSFIKEKVSEGKSVWAYGASTKGNTLLQFFELDNSLIKGIAERQPQKFGLKTVGTNIPIYSEEYVRSQNPDYMLVLPWHFISEFCEREKDFLNNGGKFIVPCPNFEIVSES